ncbi:MAG TPA: UDP-diphosphatase [Elusimicrobia bacterium]|nr:UDP-diphosphatase [Elusimicrobiota bacterium]HBT61605.1 UDP-diphosphatase [Elusimicrobiota bacterium]
MTYLNAAVLGLVQGLGEFLPISSSAHLVLIPWLCQWEYQGKAYDVALHWGTMIAVCAYFRKDWIRLIRSGLSRESSPERGLFWAMILATVPGGLAGLMLEKQAETIFNLPAPICAALAGFGLALGLADKLGRKNKSIASLNWRSILIIGLAQALAIIPGVSRSGITITAGLCLGLEREQAARFSFLLSVPIVAAAGLLTLRHVGAAALTGPFWLGIAATALTGWFSIRFLLAYLKDRGMGLFVAYRVLLALFCILWAWR